MEIHQLKDKTSFPSEAEFGQFQGINFTKRQVVANRYLLALGHSISILSYFEVEKESGDHSASIFNALVQE